MSVASGGDGAMKAGNRSSSRDPPPGSGGPEEAAAGPIHDAEEGNKGGGGQLKGEWYLGRLSSTLPKDEIYWSLSMFF